MAVCSYYLRGACKYGDRCRNEHPNPNSAGSFGNHTWTSSNNRLAVPYTAETIIADITPNKDKPLWPLSSYGPSKYEPIVISGLDESPEELRLKAVLALKAGTTVDYTKYEGEKTSAADQVYTNARNNIRQLYEQALKASARAQGQADAGSAAPVFTTSTPSAFGTSSVTSAFGVPVSASGQPSQTTSVFGQTTQAASPFAQPTQPNPVFGKPSVFGQPGQATSAFGQITQGTSAFTQSAQPSPFGKPSAFSQPGQATSAFGQPMQATSTQPSSVFGQPSSFGQASQATSAFGQATQVMSAFGRPTQPNSVFGQPSAFGQAATSAFGQTTQTTSSFNQPTQPSSVFGQPSAFSTVSSPMTITPSSEKPALSGMPDFSGAKSTARMKPGADRYLEFLPHDYNEIIPADVKAAFTSAKFEWGKIPDWIPPAELR